MIPEIGGDEALGTALPAGDESLESGSEKAWLVGHFGLHI